MKKAETPRKMENPQVRLTLVWKPEAFGAPTGANKFKPLQKGPIVAGLASARAGGPRHHGSHHPGTAGAGADRAGGGGGGIFRAGCPVRRGTALVFQANVGARAPNQAGGGGVFRGVFPG